MTVNLVLLKFYIFSLLASFLARRNHAPSGSTKVNTDWGEVAPSSSLRPGTEKKGSNTSFNLLSLERGGNADVHASFSRLSKPPRVMLGSVNEDDEMGKMLSHSSAAVVAGKKASESKVPIQIMVSEEETVQAEYDHEGWSEHRRRSPGSAMIELGDTSD